MCKAMRMIFTVSSGFAETSLNRPFQFSESLRSLDLGSAAVNEQFDTRDETGVIRRQK